MPHLHTIDTMRQYPEVVDLVLAQGKSRSPRGRHTIDAGQVTVVLNDPTKALATGVGRGLSPRVAAVEAAQLTGAFCDPKMMVWASPAFQQYRDEGTGWFWGAYGERVGKQVREAMYKLTDDIDTRQAVVTLWDPVLDNEGGHPDYPCTVGFGFSTRELPGGGPRVLDMHVTMRSNDVWLGFPYDVFQFTQLQLTVARVLRLEVGRYVHTAWSMHLYRENVTSGEINRLTKDRSEPHETFQPQGFGAWQGNTWDLASRRARMIGHNDNLDLIASMTESEEWYVRQLAGYFATPDLG